MVAILRARFNNLALFMTPSFALLIMFGPKVVLPNRFR